MYKYVYHPVTRYSSKCSNQRDTYNSDTWKNYLCKEMQIYTLTLIHEQLNRKKTSVKRVTSAQSQTSLIVLILILCLLIMMSFNKESFKLLALLKRGRGSDKGLVDLFFKIDKSPQK